MVNKKFKKALAGITTVGLLTIASVTSVFALGYSHEIDFWAGSELATGKVIVNNNTASASLNTPGNCDFSINAVAVDWFSMPYEYYGGSSETTWCTAYFQTLPQVMIRSTTADFHVYAPDGYCDVYNVSVENPYF